MDSSKSNGTFPLNRAKAKVTYHFYRSDNPLAYVDSSFEITCSDQGDIHDNA